MRRSRYSWSVLAGLLVTGMAAQAADMTPWAANYDTATRFVSKRFCPL